MSISGSLVLDIPISDGLLQGLLVTRLLSGEVLDRTEHSPKNDVVILRNARLNGTLACLASESSSIWIDS
jgi:hypothetical protein